MLLSPRVYAGKPLREEGGREGGGGGGCYVFTKLCTAALFIHQTRLQLTKKFRINWQHQSGNPTEQTTRSVP